MESNPGIVPDEVRPSVAMARVVGSGAEVESRLLGSQAGLDDVVGAAGTRRLGDGRRDQDGEREQKALHVEWCTEGLPRETWTMGARWARGQRRQSIALDRRLIYVLRVNTDGHGMGRPHTATGNTATATTTATEVSEERLGGDEAREWALQESSMDGGEAKSTLDNQPRNGAVTHASLATPRAILPVPHKSQPSYPPPPWWPGLLQSNRPRTGRMRILICIVSAVTEMAGFQ